MAPTPPPVVDSRYCAPNVTAFTVQRALWNDFIVMDASGAAVMKVSAFTFLHRYLLVDVSDASRRPVLTVERSGSLFGRRWEAYSGNSSSRSNLLFTAVEVPSLFTREDIHVHLVGRGQRDPDFIVASRGFSGREYTVSRGRGDGVAQIKLGLFFDDYIVSVNAGVDYAFILALTAIVEDIRREDVRRKRT